MTEQRRILLVDDEPDIREFISYNLTRKGYLVETAPDGKAGYETAVRFQPDLIILDIMMPVMNGYESCIRLRQNPMFDNTCILFLSALSESYARELSNKLQVNGFLNKPIRIELLVRRVDEWIRKAS
jgi:two-component system, OmpR family, alkaline phosphatase synthesis response regulator PhoP